MELREDADVGRGGRPPGSARRLASDVASSARGRSTELRGVPTTDAILEVSKMFRGCLNIVTMAILVLTAAGATACRVFDGPIAATAAVVVGLYLSLSPRLIRDWERGVVLRLGKC